MSSVVRRAGSALLSLIERALDPASEANRILVYGKDVAGVTQLFTCASDNTISQLTPVSVFGNDFQTAEVTARTTTTSAAFQTKVTMTTPALTGTYRIGWKAQVDSNLLGLAGGAGEVRVQNTTDAVTVDGTPVFQSVLATTRDTVGGFKTVAFTGAAKTLEIQFRATTGTAGIGEARLELWRIS